MKLTQEEQLLLSQALGIATGSAMAEGRDELAIKIMNLWNKIRGEELEKFTTKKEAA